MNVLNNKFFNFVSVFFMLFLVCSLTPANALTLGEVQDNVNKLNDNLKKDKLDKKTLLSQLKLLKTQLSILIIESKENTQVIEAETKEKQRNLIAYRNIGVKDGSNSYANDAVDHIVRELIAKHFLAVKAFVPLEQLKNNTIVQLVNEKGYISYVVYDGLVQTEDGKTIVLIKNTPFQSQRYMTLKDFQKNYTGITIAISAFKSSIYMAQEIWEIQGKDLKDKLSSLKADRDSVRHWINFLYAAEVFVGLNIPTFHIFSISLLIYLIHCQNLKKKEKKALEAQIKLVEDEMRYLGFIGA